MKVSVDKNRAVVVESFLIDFLKGKRFHSTVGFCVCVTPTFAISVNAFVAREYLGNVPI